MSNGARGVPRPDWGTSASMNPINIPLHGSRTSDRIPSIDIPISGDVAAAPQRPRWEIGPMLKAPPRRLHVECIDGIHVVCFRDSRLLSEEEVQGVAGELAALVKGRKAARLLLNF